MELLHNGCNMWHTWSKFRSEILMKGDHMRDLPLSRTRTLPYTSYSAHNTRASFHPTIYTKKLTNVVKQPQNLSMTQTKKLSRFWTHQLEDILLTQSGIFFFFKIHPNLRQTCFQRINCFTSDPTEAVNNNCDVVVPSSTPHWTAVWLVTREVSQLVWGCVRDQTVRAS